MRIRGVLSLGELNQDSQELTLTEEILLLLGDEDGSYLPIRTQAFECALVGATLMDLAFEDRIDTDLESLVVISSNPIGHPALDLVLSTISSRTSTTDTQTWVRSLSDAQAGLIREQTLTGLVERGVLERHERRFFGLFESVRYTTIDHTPKNQATDKIRAAFNEVIPDPRDIALVTLADSCQLLPDLLSENLIDKARLTQLRRMDLIGREVASTVADIQRTIMLATQAQARRSQKWLLWLSVTVAVCTAAVLFLPRIPVPESFGFSVLRSLWLDRDWQEWSGYLLLALTALVLLAGIVVRNRLVAGIVEMRRWRFFHVAIGLLCVLALFVHTGFRLGVNLNVVLIGFYLATLALGALVGMMVGAGQRLRQIGFSNGAQSRRMLLWLHVATACPLLALLVVHILTAYLY